MTTAALTNPFDCPVWKCAMHPSRNVDLRFLSKVLLAHVSKNGVTNNQDR